MRRREFIGMASASAIGILTLFAIGGSGQSASSASGARVGAEGAMSLFPPPPHEEKGALLAIPGEALKLSASVSDPLAGDTNYGLEAGPSFRWRCEEGSLLGVNGGKTAWRAPGKAIDTVVTCEYEATYRPTGGLGRLGASKVVRLSARARVIAPAPSSLLVDGVIDGYKIGVYPTPNDPRFAAHANWPRMYPDVYAIPSGFYKVTKENRNVHISENFTLGDFAHAFPWESLGLPQYIALDYRLVEKLEALLALLRVDGVAKRKFVFIYGFRSPAYNLSTRADDPQGTLKEPFSMHQYGKAADIIVDDDGDLVMDDLNGDGKSDIEDARVLLKYVDRLDEKYLIAGDPKLGGAGDYSHNDFRQRKQSPYVHVDVRGFASPTTGKPVRWTVQ